METTRDIVIKTQAQAGRIAAELESEKRTRADSHKLLNEKLDKIDIRLQRQDRWFAIGIGILMTLQAGNTLGLFDRYKPHKDPPTVKTAILLPHNK